MGMSSTAHIAYGYNLGGPEIWNVQGLGEYGSLRLDWYDEDADERPDFLEVATRRLLAAIGFTETYEDGNAGYFDREGEAEARLTVGIRSMGSYDYPSHVLYAAGTHDDVDWGATAVTLAVPDGADEHLAAALTALGIRPTQEAPSWVIGSFYG